MTKSVGLAIAITYGKFSARPAGIPASRYRDPTCLGQSASCNRPLKVDFHCCANLTWIRESKNTRFMLFDVAIFFTRQLLNLAAGYIEREYRSSGQPFCSEEKFSDEKVLARQSRLHGKYSAQLAGIPASRLFLKCTESRLSLNNCSSSA